MNKNVVQAQTRIILGKLICLLQLLRPPVRREISIIRIYMHIIDFLRFPENGDRTHA